MSGQSSLSLISSPLFAATVRADVDEGASMLHDHEAAFTLERFWKRPFSIRSCTGPWIFPPFLFETSTSETKN